MYLVLFFLLTVPLTPRSPLFPYTTLFRSSKLFLILKSGVNHTSRGSISTSTLPSIKLRKCSSKIITSILSFISGRLATKSNQIKERILRSEERFNRNAETDLVCRLLLEKKKDQLQSIPQKLTMLQFAAADLRQQVCR